MHVGGCSRDTTASRGIAAMVWCHRDTPGTWGSRRVCCHSFRLELDMGKMNPQLIANEEKQDRAEGGKNEAGGMIAFIFRA
jgi:hypothetical protein